MRAEVARQNCRSGRDDDAVRRFIAWVIRTRRWKLSGSLTVNEHDSLPEYFELSKRASRGSNGTVCPGS